ncbi:unnamed protein product, partial [Polarella glacialis]
LFWLKLLKLDQLEQLDLVVMLLLLLLSLLLVGHLESHSAMASSSNDGRALNVTLVDIGGTEITRGTWQGDCKALELFQAAYKSKPGFLCKLLHGGRELSPQTDLASLRQ